MRSLLPLVAISLLAASIAACRGNVVGRAELHAAGTATATFPSNGQRFVLWADTEGKWSGTDHFPAHYEIDVFSNDANIGHVSCTTEGARESICGVMVTEGSTHEGDCELKLSCELPLIPAGSAILKVTGSPGSQAISVKKLSINVRDK